MTIIIKNSSPEVSNVQSAADFGILTALRITPGDHHYLVDFGEGIYPRYHYVFNMARGMTCLCAAGANCPAIMFAQERAAGVEMQLATAEGETRGQLEAELKQVGVMPDKYLLGFLPRYCPECGGLVSADPVWNGKYTGLKGWRCMNHGITCFIRYKSRPILEWRREDPDPYVIPPVKDAQGQVLYAGVLLSELGLPGHSPYIEAGESYPLPSTAVLCDRSTLEQPIAVDFGIALDSMAQAAG